MNLTLGHRYLLKRANVSYSALFEIEVREFSPSGKCVLITLTSRLPDGVITYWKEIEELAQSYIIIDTLTV